jgi:hypothetical protein
LKKPVEYSRSNPASSKLNTDAILKAYREGKLDVEYGEVSYRVDGEQMTGLVEMNWDQGDRILEKYRGHACWLERVSCHTHPL